MDRTTGIGRAIGVHAGMTPRVYEEPRGGVTPSEGLKPNALHAHHHPSFGGISQALSASPLSHAERPLGLAFLRYPAFSCGVQRNRTTAVAGVLMGGLPLGRLGWFMACIMWLQIILDKGARWVFTVATLIRRQIMRTTANVQVVACYIKRLGFFRQEVRYVAKVPEGYRLARQYPHSWTWPVRDSIEAALADAE
jgi:hypothetical protein